MTKYYRITERELIALKDVSDSMSGMVGSGCEDFDAEAEKGEKAINSILKRNKLRRIENEFSYDIKL